MKTQSFFEQNGGIYMQVGDLTVEKTKSIGRRGRMHKRYLKEHRPTVYSNMILNGSLYKHLADIDERIDLITTQLARKHGITEKLKAEDQLRCVQEMNAIRLSAEETVLAELIYAY